MTLARILSVAAISLLLLACSKSSSNQKLNSADNATDLHKQPLIYLTTSDQSALFQQQTLTPNKQTTPSTITIKVSPEKTYQEMDGFGFTLTGGSAKLLNDMSAAARQTLLDQLFRDDKNNIGTSYLRLSLGASDLDSKVFSYNDLPFGETDINLEKFTIDEDKKHLIPILKQILAINPTIKIMASPWSPPPWMKTNNASKGGELKPEYYQVYAQYFVKYIQAMQKEGIIIDAITIQNEPLHPGNNPSLYMLANTQANFIKNHLGPTFQSANIKTKIVIYDHNADRPDYPISILNDEDAKQYIDGSAFHLYGGNIESLSEVHNTHPDKNIYFTEQWIGAPTNFPEDMKWHIRELIIGATRNWSKTVLEWNLAADPNLKPHTIGGCDRCLGAVTIGHDFDNGKDKVIKNPAYYIIAHAAKFVRPGSLRIHSTFNTDLPNVAFKTPSGNIVVIVLNDSKNEQSFAMDIGDEKMVYSLSAGAIATYVWQTI